MSMPELIKWRKSWNEALQEAKKSHLPVALELFMEGCPACGRLARETHPDPAVVEALNNRFIPVRLEARDHLDLAEQYQVTATPTILLFSSNGEEMHRFDGFQTPEDYLTELDKAGEKTRKE
jgi:thioredoxin-related protein